MQTKNILTKLGAMTSKELLAHIHARTMPHALRIAPPGFYRPGRAKTATAQQEGFAMNAAIAAIGSATR